VRCWQVRDLLVYTERFREWLSVAVLQSYLGLLANQHTCVNDLMNSYNMPLPRLPPLTEVLGDAEGSSSVQAAAEAVNRIVSTIENPGVPQSIKDQYAPLFLVSGGGASRRDLRMHPTA
jgi:hypothetical protein